MFSYWNKLSIRAKLIVLFIGIKVLPLAMLGGVAMYQARATSENLSKKVAQISQMADGTITVVGQTAISDATTALDARAREEIESLTTHTARSVASFLYSRDADILYARSLEPSAALYRNFVQNQRRNLTYHGEWVLAEDSKSWTPVKPLEPDPSTAEPGSPDNAHQFNYVPPTPLPSRSEPLYLEMTFVGLDGRERIKVTTSDHVSSQLRDVSIRTNTYAKAETYFNELKKLRPGEIYVSDVIGTYIGSKIIGTYTPEAAQKRGIPFEPHKSAYAGMENPVGERFRGIIRWATPVVRGGQITGWVTLALNHDHLMAFTDTIVPTEERYRNINDAADGNYAFIWDYKGRSIVHPRHHSIVGFEEHTGEPAVPWLEDVIYDAWQESGKSYTEFIQTVPVFDSQLQSKRPARTLTESGLVGLDCRYLNFAPQCTGWYNLTKEGGSGSFLILWSGLWKLTTSAAIPYYTGQYNPTVTGNRRGFGIVTIGANVADFHRAATESKARLDVIIGEADTALQEQTEYTTGLIWSDLTRTATSLTLSTLIMIGIVVFIAVWMASFLSSRIKVLNDGFSQFRSGNIEFRFEEVETDELAELAHTFNEMADELNKNFARLNAEIEVRTEAEKSLRVLSDSLEIRVAERTEELSKANIRLEEEIHAKSLAEAKAQHLAGHDQLTGLANRLLFLDRLQLAMNQSHRSLQTSALLFFDLDRFKEVNDTYGHSAGDGLLVHVAQILQHRARKTDTIARLGGDEFAVIMTDMGKPDDAAIFAQEILDLFAVTTKIEGHEMRVYASVGIATFSGNFLDIEQILAHADFAMYQAKAAGGSRFQFFEESMQNMILNKRKMEAELRTALKERQFVPYFQPLFDTSAQRVVGMESYVRWMHPTRGILAPGEFFPTAQSAGLIPPIDYQMAQMVAAQIRKWLDSNLEFGRVSLNVQQGRISSPDFIPSTRRILDECGVSAKYKTLDIREITLMDDQTQTLENLTELRNMGFQIAIDDFGTTALSLQKLVEYPIDKIKIDRKFVHKIGSKNTEALISSIISMTTSIGLMPMGKGVETQEQLDFLIKNNCPVYQGYLLAHPMSADDATKYLEAHARLQAAKRSASSSAPGSPAPQPGKDEA